MATRADENLLSVGVPDSRPRTEPYFVHCASRAMRALGRTIADIASTDISVLLVCKVREFRIDGRLHLSALAALGKCFGCGCGEQRIVVSAWDQSSGTSRTGTPA